MIEAYQRTLLKWRDNPEAMILDLWPQVKLEEWQKEAFRALQTHDHLTIRSGHGVGKTFWLSMTMLWWILTRADSTSGCRIPCTAPTSNQLHDVLWSELHKWHRRMPAEIRDMINVKADRMEHVGNPKNAFAVARTARREQPEAFQGFHEDNMLFIVDEACLADDTEVLTDNGFKLIKEIGRADLVLSMDPETGVADYYKPSKYIGRKFEGEMVHFHHQTMDMLVTPNHRVVYSTNAGEQMFAEAEELVGRKINVRRSVDLAHRDRVEVFRGGGIECKMDDFLEFLGWYLSEGSLAKVNDKFYRTVISQSRAKNPENHAAIFDVCMRMGLNPRDYSEDVMVNNPEFSAYLAEFGVGFYNKAVPRWVFKLPNEQIRKFLDSFNLGDGYVKEGKKVNYTSSPTLANDLQELIILAGGYASIVKRSTKGERNWIVDHYATTKHDGYVIAEYKNYKQSTIYPNSIKRVPYSGMVYCLTVEPHHTLYVRRNGKCCWTGNSGVDDLIFEVGEGALSTPGAKVLMTGNPTRTHGYFYDSHHKMRDEWYTMKVSCFDSSRVDKKFPERIKKRYGEESNVYSVRVLGEFPREDEDAVIPLGLIEDAVVRSVHPSDGPVVWGVDVARQGADRSAIAKRRRNVLLEPIKNWRSPDLMVTAGRIKQEYDDTKREDQPKYIFVDVIGMGAGVLDRLREYGLPAIGVNVAESPSIGRTYHRLRDELWFKARDWFRARDCKIPKDESLIAELSIPRYFYNHNGRLRVTSKDDMKAKGMQSPDLADAFCLTFNLHADNVRQDKIVYPEMGIV